MRTGACTLQQALTPEAATVLKHSLTLAKSRGHSHLTPLHVASTLLISSTSPNLLRRACFNSHPLHCRALELCFNVALNRLPTNPPPSSLIHPNPSLSNALIAALKRAQAHHRRGCTEHQQQQPILAALKVGLDQLIISILDDPSVSRVMTEAGFNSTCVKNNIEGHNISSELPPPPSSLFFATHFLKPPSEPNPLAQNEDLRVVLEVMRRSSSTVVVGDSAAMREGIVGEMKRRVERGEVPDELKSASFINLQLSYLQLRLMSRDDVEMKVSDVRTKICSLASGTGNGGVIINAGDLRWAVDEETRDGFSPVDHMIAEVGRLLTELRSCNRVWLVGTASYQAYMRCKMRKPSLETQWALQAVVVPSGRIALSLQAPSGLDSRVIKLSQHPFQMLEPKSSTPKDEEDKLNCCVECTANYEREALVFKSGTKVINSGSSNLPYWLQPHNSDNNNHKNALLELRRKWNRLCQSLHHARRNQIHLHPLLFNLGLVGTPSLPHNQSNIIAGPRLISIADSFPKSNVESPKPAGQMRKRIGNSNEREVPNPMQCLSEVSLHSLKRDQNQEVRTTLALGSTLVTDSATSNNQREVFPANMRELSQLLQENIHWHSETIPSIVEALLECRSSEKKGTWLLIEGTDRIGKRRLAQVVADSLCGSMDRLNHINASTSQSRTSSWAENLTEALRKGTKCVVLIEEMDRAHVNFRKTLDESLENGFFEDQFGKEVGIAHGIFILTTSNSTKLDDADENPDNVVKMRLSIEDGCIWVLLGELV